MRSPAARKDLAAFGSVIALTSTLLREMSPTRAGDHQHRVRGGSRQTWVRLCARLCASFDPVSRSTPMKMRLMRSGAWFTFGPFALVATLAAGIALAGYLASPHPLGDSARTERSTPSATSARTAV